MALLDLSQMGAGGYDVAPDYGVDEDTLKKAIAAQIAARMRQQSPNVPAPTTAPGDLPQDAFGSLAPALPAASGQQAPLVPGAPAPALPPAQTVPPASMPNASAGNNAPPSNALDNQILSAQAGQTPQPVTAAATQAANANPSLLQKLNNWSGQNSNLMLALGAGLMGAPSVGTGLQRAFSNAQPVMQQNQTVQALMARGMPADLARMAASNPAALNQILPRIMGIKQQQFTEIGQDMFGNKKYGFVDPVSGTVTPFTGGATSSNTATTTGGAAQPGATPTLANFDIAKIDPNLKGDDYLKQWPQEVQDAAKSFMAGNVMPTGNPRNNNISSIAKTVAQKYAMDIGQPNLADDSLFSERRKMRTELGSSSQGSMGGILSNGKSAFEHLGTLSDKMTALGNTNGLNIPGGGHIASAENFIGNAILPTSDTKDKLQQAADAALKYGQESTKFYSGTGGGEAERMFALKNLDFNSAPAAQQAGFLQTEKELMTARLGQKEQQIRDTLGQSYLDEHPVVTPDLKATLSKIDSNIAKLRGEKPTDAAQSPAAPPSPGRYIYNPASGKMVPAQ